MKLVYIPLFLFLILIFFLWRGLSFNPAEIVPSVTTPQMHMDISTLHFENAKQQEDYIALTQQLRCLVCLNGSIADSQSDFAKSLKYQVAEMVHHGDSQQRILDALTKRYGEVILYHPPLQKNTYFLWFFPFLALSLGILLFFSLRK